MDKADRATMIPGDLAARLRLLTEASFFADEPPIGPLQRTRAIPEQLPEYRPGDRFSAQIQKALPDGTFEALVDGKSIKLALPQSARPGDILELVVARQTPRAVLAHPVPSTPADAGTRPALSTTARLISFLLTGQPAPEAASLGGGKPLVPAGPVNPGVLAPVLRQALSESGLFYESQQARWVAGKVPTETLLRQPQGQQPAPAAPPSAQTNPHAAAGTRSAGASTPLAPLPGLPAAETAATGDARGSASTAAAAPARAPLIAERLVPVMHQQLDAMATHHYAWQGQVWPGQQMALEIEDPYDEHAAPAGEDGATWNTTLRLSLPQLGDVEARLALDGSGIRIRLAADTDAAVGTLSRNQQALAKALAAVDIAVQDMQVGRQDDRRER